MCASSQITCRINTMVSDFRGWNELSHIAGLNFHVHTSGCHRRECAYATENGPGLWPAYFVLMIRCCGD